MKAQAKKKQRRLGRWQKKWVIAGVALVVLVFVGVPALLSHRSDIKTKLR